MKPNDANIAAALARIDALPAETQAGTWAVLSTHARQPKVAPRPVAPTPNETAATDLAQSISDFVRLLPATSRRRFIAQLRMVLDDLEAA